MPHHSAQPEIHEHSPHVSAAPWGCRACGPGHVKRGSHSCTGSPAGGRYLRLAKILFRMLRSSKAEISASWRKEENKFFTGRHRHHLISSLLILRDWWSRSASLRVSVWCGCTLIMKPIWPVWIHWHQQLGAVPLAHLPVPPVRHNSEILTLPASCPKSFLKLGSMSSSLMSV